MNLRFSKATTLFITGIISLTELTLASYPALIPVDSVRYFIIGLLPITINFLYQEEGLVAVPESVPPVQEVSLPTGETKTA
jgi:hypothetical protein